MDIGMLKKSYLIENFDSESGLITVTYKAKLDDEELSPITRTLELPLDNRIKDQKYIEELLELNFPHENFQQQRLVRRSDLEENLESQIKGFEKDIEEKVEEEVQPDEENLLDKGESVYGHEYQANVTRHLIIETLEDLGILK